MLIRGGENVYPREVEEFLFRHPKVQSAQVFGVPDAKYGEEVCAWIVLKAGEQASARRDPRFLPRPDRALQGAAPHPLRAGDADDDHRQGAEVRDARADDRGARARRDEYDGLTASARCRETVVSVILRDPGRTTGATDLRIPPSTTALRSPPMNPLPGLAFDLGETIDMLRDSVQAFAAAEIAPRAAAIDRDNLFPADLWQKLGDLGLHGITVDGGVRRHRPGLPRAHGGDGGDLARLGLGRAVLRRAFQPLRQPDPPQRHRGAEAPLPAEADHAASTSARWR